MDSQHLFTAQEGSLPAASSPRPAQPPSSSSFSASRIIGGALYTDASALQRPVSPPFPTPGVATSTRTTIATAPLNSESSSASSNRTVVEDPRQMRPQRPRSSSMPEAPTLSTLAELRRCHSTSTSGAHSPAVDYTLTPPELRPYHREPDLARKTLSFLDLALPGRRPTKTCSVTSTSSMTALDRTWAHDRSAATRSSVALSSHDPSQHCATCAPPAKLSIVLQVLPHADTPLTILTGAPDLPCPLGDPTAFERAAAYKSSRSSTAQHANHCARLREEGTTGESKARFPEPPSGQSPGPTSVGSGSLEGLPRPESATSPRQRPDDPEPSASCTSNEASASAKSGTRLPPPPPPPPKESSSS